jgi:RecB family exonuclease
LLPSADGLPLIGKIDRVDEHPDFGWRALDYKTSATPKSPASMHVGRKGWKDLQLPLYSVLLESIGIAVSGTQLGYLNLSPDRNAQPLMMAKWTDVELADAKSKAEEIVGSIQSGALLDAVREELQP